MKNLEILKTKKKEELYCTAYSPLHGEYVEINHAHQDSSGEWIFTCNISIDGVNYPHYLFRKHELTRFVL